MGQSDYNAVKIELLARNSTEFKMFLLKLNLLKEEGDSFEELLLSFHHMDSRG